ncbi:MAG: hypothetical protein ACK56F_25745, partial [bacterium]
PSAFTISSLVWSDLSSHCSSYSSRVPAPPGYLLFSYILREVQPEVKPEAQPEVKPEVQLEVKPEVQPEVKPEVQPEVKPEVQPKV